MSKIWVYIDHFKGQALQPAWEAIGAGLGLASQFGGSVTALVYGKNVEALAQEAFQYGVEEVLLADEASMEDFRPEPFAALLAHLATEAKPEVILFPTTTRGREVAAMAAIDLNTGVLADVTGRYGACRSNRRRRPSSVWRSWVTRSAPARVSGAGRGSPAGDSKRHGDFIKRSSHGRV